jgi:hypothetical protein
MDEVCGEAKVKPSIDFLDHGPQWVVAPREQF